MMRCAVREGQPGQAGPVRPPGSAAQQFQLNLGVARSDHAEFPGGGARQVDHAAADIGAAIVDLDHDGLAVARIGHPHAAAEGQGLVRGGHRIHVEGRAAGGFAAMEALAVIARRAGAERGATGRLDRGNVDRAGLNFHLGGGFGQGGEGGVEGGRCTRSVGGCRAAEISVRNGHRLLGMAGCAGKSADRQADHYHAPERHRSLSVGHGATDREEAFAKLSMFRHLNAIHARLIA